jgi:hypothetical protein
VQLDPLVQQVLLEQQDHKAFRATQDQQVQLVPLVHKAQLVLQVHKALQDQQVLVDPLVQQDRLAFKVPLEILELQVPQGQQDQVLVCIRIGFVKQP